MRVAVINWSRRIVGGAETYLSSVIPELHQAGLDLSFCSEVDAPEDRAPIPLPAGIPVWCASDMGSEAALRSLAEWKPDLVYVHGSQDVEWEAAVQRIAPSVLYAHNYHGTCVSGAKTHRLPHIHPCGRRFGPMCLVHFFPRRCGGLSPVTMLQQYRVQTQRWKLLPHYSAVLTASEHMRSEYVRNGVSSERVWRVPLPILGTARGPDPAEDRIDTEGPVRLLFCGRLDLLKGGAKLLQSLPAVRAALGRAVQLTIAGAGPQLEELGRRAAAIQARDPDVSVEFAGWVTRPRLDALFAESHLLVLPSLWPEPFGMTGVEAGLSGLPAAAFAVGGIPDWLEEGVNGHLAPGDFPTEQGLAAAIVNCLRDPVEYARLRRGARTVARRYSLESHVEKLIAVLCRVAGERQMPCHTVAY